MSKYDIVEFSKLAPNMAEFFAGNDLSVYDFIGFTEHYDDSLKRLSNKFDLNFRLNYVKKKVAPDKPVVTKDIRKKIRKINRIDMELYKEALDKFGGY